MATNTKIVPVSHTQITGPYEFIEMPVEYDAEDVTDEDLALDDAIAAVDPEISLPKADYLDSVGRRDDYRVVLYLDPENFSVQVHSGVGNIGWPEPAFLNRWLSIGSYDAGYDGESVLEALEAISDELIEAAGEYLGLDERTRRGRWSEDAGGDLHQTFKDALEEYARIQWDAGEWLSPARDEVLTNARRALAGGKTLADVANSEVEVAASEGVLLDSDDVENTIEQWLEDEDDEADLVCNRCDTDLEDAAIHCLDNGGPQQCPHCGLRFEIPRQWLADNGYDGD